MGREEFSENQSPSAAVPSLPVEARLSRRIKQQTKTKLVIPGSLTNGWGDEAQRKEQQMKTRIDKTITKLLASVLLVGALTVAADAGNQVAKVKGKGIVTMEATADDVAFGAFEVGDRFAENHFAINCKVNAQLLRAGNCVGVSSTISPCASSPSGPFNPTRVGFQALRNPVDKGAGRDGASSPPRLRGASRSAGMPFLAPARMCQVQ